MKKIILTICFGLFSIFANATIYLQLDLFIQGYYAGSGTMVAAGYIQGCWNISNKVDNLTVELHSASSPYAVVSNGTYNPSINTSGEVGCVFNITPGSDYYYIVVKHRNGLETWSSSTVTFPSTTPVNYDFTSSASQAYGSNLIEVESGVWAIYSGDLIAFNDLIDSYDQDIMDMEIENFYSGCATHGDLNGDGNVDILDSPILDDNITNNIYVMRP